MSHYLSDEWRDKLLAAGFPKEDLCIGVAEEIISKLPEALYLGEERNAVYLSIMPDGSKWIVLYSPEYDQRRCDKENFWKRSKNSLADAAAIMYVFLVEQELLQPNYTKIL